MTHLQVFLDAPAIFRAAADLIALRAHQAVRQRGKFNIVLSGGSTPHGLYAHLASESRDRVPWQHTHFFWGDERLVPPDHPDSNYNMAFETMLSHVPVPPENIHRVRTELCNPELMVADYVRELRDFFRLREGAFPRFDIVLLGLGADGHTASLFPDTTALLEQNHLVTLNRVEKLDAARITMTVPLLNNAACILFLVQGAEKADALRSVFSGELQPLRFPALLIQPSDGDLHWMADHAAAHLWRSFLR